MCLCLFLLHESIMSWEQSCSSPMVSFLALSIPLTVQSSLLMRLFRVLKGPFLLTLFCGGFPQLFHPIDEWALHAWAAREEFTRFTSCLMYHQLNNHKGPFVPLYHPDEPAGTCDMRWNWWFLRWLLRATNSHWERMEIKTPTYPFWSQVTMRQVWIFWGSLHWNFVTPVGPKPVPYLLQSLFFFKLYLNGETCL